MIEGELHTIKHRSSWPHLMREGAWMSWDWSAQ